MRLLLESNAGIAVVGEAADGHEALRLTERLRPDIVVMQVLMPRLSGLGAARRLTSRSGPRVLLLAPRVSRRTVEDALRAGASGLLFPHSSPEELVDAIRVLGAGGRCLPPEALDYLVDSVAHPAESAAEMDARLTAREREVLQLVAEGYSSREMSELVNVSVKTVESHRWNLMAKLGIHKVAGLVRYAIREGLVDP